MSVPTLVQSVASQGTGNSTGTLGSTPIQGHLMILVRAYQTNSSNINLGTETFDHASSWDKSRDYHDISAPNAVFEVIHRVAGASEPTSYSITHAGSQMGTKLMEWSGIDTTTPLRTVVDGDRVDGGVGGRSCHCGSLTPVGGELLLAVIGAAGNGPGDPTSTIDNSYTLVSQGAINDCIVAYRIAPSAAPIDPIVSWTYANDPARAATHLAYNAAPNPASDRQIPRGLFRGLTRGVT